MRLPRADRSVFVSARRAAQVARVAMIAVVASPFVVGLGAMLLAAEPSYKLIEAVDYVVRDSEPLKADFYVPGGKGPFPAVLVVHGGAWMAGNRARIAWHAEQLALHGYVAMAINYRLAPRHPFPAQLDDCQAALCWMATHAKAYKIDLGHVGGFGYSAGGHLVTLLGVLGNDSPRAACAGAPGGKPVRLRAIVAGGAPCDFCMVPPDSRRLAYWLGGTRAERPREYKMASPLRFVTPDDPPMLFFHGGDDQLVPIASAREMVAKLKAVGIHAEMYMVAEAGHVSAYRDRRAMDASIAFLDRQLKSRP